MTIALLLEGVVIVVALGVVVYLRRRSDDAGGEPVARGPVAGFVAGPLLTSDLERRAWTLLQRLPLGAHAICPKVRLEDIAQAVDRRDRGYISARHVDFLLVDRDWRPLVVVEVDGPGHGGRRAEIDARKDGILASAGVPVVRLRVGADWEAALLGWRAGGPASGGPARSARPGPVVAPGRRRVP